MRADSGTASTSYGGSYGAHLHRALSTRRRCYAAQRQAMMGRAGACRQRVRASADTKEPHSAPRGAEPSAQGIPPKHPAHTDGEPAKLAEPTKSAVQDMPKQQGTGEAPSTSGSAEAKPPSQHGPTNGEATETAEMAGLWNSIKQDLRKQLPPEDAEVLDKIKVDDLLGNPGDLMRKVADEQLGPLLAAMGVAEDPLAFFLDLLRRGAMLQLLSAGGLFYGAELLGGYDAGEALRCVCGLSLGYLSRPFLRTEAVMWPLYDGLLRVVAPGTEYKVSASTEDSIAALSSMGVAIAVASLLPQLLWGWDAQASLQFVAPLAAGWLLFDVVFMAALLLKLGR